MAIQLKKGEKINLKKVAPALNVILVGLGWDARASDGQDFDLDASAFMLNAGGKTRSDADFIFYDQPKDSAESVVYGGDNRTGAGEGDDETITVTLNKVPQDVHKIAFTVSIYEARTRAQSFGQVSNAFIRLVNQDTGEEIIRYDLSEDYSVETGLIFAELYRHGGEWKFGAVGQGYEGGLHSLAANFGVETEAED